MTSIISDLFHRLPPRARAALKRRLAPLVRGSKHAALFARDFRVPVQVAGDDSLRVVFIGRDVSADQFTRSLFGHSVKPEPAGNVFAWNVRAEVDSWRKKAQLIVVSLHDLWCKGALERETFRRPRFVVQVLDLPPSPDDLRAGIQNRSARDDMRRILKTGFTYAVVRPGMVAPNRESDFIRRFYEEFHRPMVDSRHGDAGYLLPFEDFLHYFEEGELLLVKLGDRPLSGIVCQRTGDDYKTLIAGLYHADPELLRSGAMAAWYYFAILHAIQIGCRRVIFGRNHPLIHDGILQFKNKWTTRLERNYTVERDFRLALGFPSSTLKQWLVANPFVMLERGAFASLVFVDEHTPPDAASLARLLRKAHLAGTKAVCVVSLAAGRDDLAATAAAFEKNENAPTPVIEWGNDGEFDPVAFTRAVKRTLER